VSLVLGHDEDPEILDDITWRGARANRCGPMADGGLPVGLSSINE
jgi:hypothetical protein